MTVKKICRKCNRRLAISKFGVRASGDGYKRRSRCKECESEYARSRNSEISIEKKRSVKKKYLDKNPEKSRYWANRSSWRKVGLDPDRIGLYRDQHNGNCDICGRNDSVVGTLHVDHCHKNSIFRGMVCSNCNLGLGKFRDDPVALEAAAAYLRRSPPPLPELEKKIDIRLLMTEQEAARMGVSVEEIMVTRRPACSRRGDDAPWSKLTAENVRSIRTMLSEGVPIAKIAPQFGVSRMAIYLIRDGKNRKYDL